MFANNTVETGTGTGDIITLTGAVSYTNEAGRVENSRPFSLGFNDGALVSYFIVDHTGGNEVAGIGTYNAVGNTLTRNDTESYNGSILDKNPGANIALSGGTHTVRCDVVVNGLNSSAGMILSEQNSLNQFHAMPDNWVSMTGTNQSVGAANRVVFVPAYYSSRVSFNSLAIEVTTASATDTVGIAIVSCGSDGMPKEVIDQVIVDVTTTGWKYALLSKTYNIPAGRYFVAATQTDITAGLRSTGQMTHGGRSGAYQYRSFNNGHLYVNSYGITGVIPSVIDTTSMWSSDPNRNISVIPRMT